MNSTNKTPQSSKQPPGPRKSHYGLYRSTRCPSLRPVGHLTVQLQEPGLYRLCTAHLPPNVQHPAARNQNHYDTGENAACRGLAMFFVQQAHPLNPFVEQTTLERRSWSAIGTMRAPSTPMQPTFTRDEITGKLSKVLEKVLNVQKQRKETVIAWAVEWRAYALGVAKADKGQNAHLPMHFSSLLKTTGLGNNTISPWSKVDFLSGCVGLRAAARSYLDEWSAERRELILKSWKEGLAEFLLEGDQVADDEHKKFRDGDFQVKFHAILLPNNLTTGPKDKNSDDLFSMENWSCEI